MHFLISIHFTVACISIFTMSSIQDVKKARTSAKTKVTKLCNRISQLVAEEEDLSSVPELVNRLKFEIELCRVLVIA